MPWDAVLAAHLLKTPWACTTCDVGLQQRIASCAPLRVLGLIGLTTLVPAGYILWWYRRPPEALRARPRGQYLIPAGLLLGAGLGGIADAMVLHDLLQWHQTISGWFYPATLVDERVNMFWDGIHILGDWLLCLLGIALLLSAQLRPTDRRLICAAMVTGLGVINTVDATINHLIAGLHNFREISGHHLAWNLGYLLSALGLLAGGRTWVARCLTQRGIVTNRDLGPE